MTQNKQPQNLRQERGLAIAKEFNITKESDKTWLVPSQNDTKTYYVVKSNGFGSECSCPDCKKGEETFFFCWFYTIKYLGK